MKESRPKQVEDAADATFREMCEIASDLIQCVAPDGRFLYANRAWFRTLGYEAGDLPRITVFDVIHPDSRDHCERLMKQVLAGLPAVSVEADFRSKDGRRIHVEGSASPRVRDGKVIATVGIFRDVSRRRRTQDQLDKLFNLSMDMLCVAGVDGYFKQINPAFEKILKFSREELLSHAFLECVHPDDRESTMVEVGRLAKGLPVVDFQNRYRDKDGSWHWLAWRSTPLAEQGLIYAVARDITDQKRVLEDLARSNEALERFAYSASHDLRAPLRAIANLAEWIEQDAKDGLSETSRGHLETLRDRVRRMEDLTEDLLQYSRAGRPADETRSVDTGKLVSDLVHLLAPPDGFVIEAVDPMPVLQTNRAPLEQVLRNLIGNAVKHHDRKEGRVVVRSRDHGQGLWEFTVEDDGPGIPDEYHDRVFEMFRQLRPRDEVGGTGMGLALVRRIVESVGGSVWLEKGRRRGTVFHFTWPRVAAGEQVDAGDSRR